MVGSSPLARGTHWFQLHNPGVEGLIPARAGNTTMKIIKSKTHRAHPRSRGEHIIWDMAYGIALGSSPLARGTRHSRRRVRLHGGLIPARAGNTR